MTSAVTLRLNAQGVEDPAGTLVTKPLSAWMFEGRFNPGQLQIIREIKPRVPTMWLTSTRPSSKVHVLTIRFSATADGQVIVTDVTELNIDGSDRLRDIERLEFSDGSRRVDRRYRTMLTC